MSDGGQLSHKRRRIKDKRQKIVDKKRGMIQWI